MTAPVCARCDRDRELLNAIQNGLDDAERALVDTLVTMAAGTASANIEHTQAVVRCLVAVRRVYDAAFDYDFTEKSSTRGLRIQSEMSEAKQAAWASAAVKTAGGAR